MNRCNFDCVCLIRKSPAKGKFLWKQSHILHFKPKFYTLEMRTAQSTSLIKTEIEKPIFPKIDNRKRKFGYVVLCTVWQNSLTHTRTLYHQQWNVTLLRKDHRQSATEHITCEVLWNKSKYLRWLKSTVTIRHICPMAHWLIKRRAN